MIAVTSDSTQSQLTLRLLGPMQVLVHGQPLPHVRSRKTLWLLALLALRQDRPVVREWLAGTLWPDTEQARASVSLRVTLSELRNALGDQGDRLRSPSRHTLTMDLFGADVDLRVFDQAMASQEREALRQAVALYRGPLLEGCYEEWVAQERNAREASCLCALQTLAEAAAEARDYRTAAQYYRQATSLDPLMDEARRGLMESLARNGDSNAALDVYQEFVRLLRKDDPKATPDERTSALYAQLRTDARRRASTPPSARRASPTPATAVKGRVPRPLTALIGREDERVAVAARMRQSRLVTLTGLGGIGKTRLAVEIAAESIPEFPDGVWMVSLETLTDVRAIALQIVSTLGLREESGKPPIETLIADLREKSLLLVLDNCEHILDASAQTAARLLQECAGLRILATSRESMAITGEIAWRVPSLAVPDAAHLPSGTTALLRVLNSYDGVRLFVERAQAVKQDFDLTEETAMAVADICARLEGIPLAIELAAARVKALTAKNIASRLHDHMALLTGGSRTALPRQHTLRATLDWSFALLNERERILLRRLSVFVGGWTLEAAAQVCAGGGIGASQVADLLTSLVSKSLILFEERDPALGGRYRVLEMVRQYAAEVLRASGEMETLKARHRDWCVTLAEASTLMEPDPSPSLRALDMEYDNLRASLEWCATSEREAEEGLRLAAALGRYWFLRNLYSEGRRYLEQALGREGAQFAGRMRARALNAAGILVSCLADYAAARNLMEECLRIYRQLGETANVAVVSGNLGTACTFLGDFAAARRLYEESLAAHRELGESLGAARTLNGLGNLLSRQGDFTEARRLLEESLSLRKEREDRRGIAVTGNSLGNVALMQGDLVMAKTLFEESLRINRDLGDWQGIAISLERLGNVLRNQGEYTSALALYEESQSIFDELGARAEVVSVLCNLAELAYRQGDGKAAHTLYVESLRLGNTMEDKKVVAAGLDGLATLMLSRAQFWGAARLYGATSSLCDSIGILAPGRLRKDYERQIETVRLELGEEKFASLWAEGAAFSWEEAITYAIAAEHGL